MRKILAVFITALLFAASACTTAVTSGTVSDKRLVEEHTEQVEIMETEEECEWDTDTKTVNGKKKTTREYECEDVEVGTGEYEDKTYPAEYYLTLEDKDGNDQEHEVTEEEYNSVEVGDQFDTEAQ